jgi:hypothetical protein
MPRFRARTPVLLLPGVHVGSVDDEPSFCFSVSVSADVIVGDEELNAGEAEKART